LTFLCVFIRLSAETTMLGSSSRVLDQVHTRAFKAPTEDRPRVAGDLLLCCQPCQVTPIFIPSRWARSAPWRVTNFKKIFAPAISITWRLSAISGPCPPATVKSERGLRSPVSLFDLLPAQEALYCDGNELSVGPLTPVRLHCQMESAERL
jgi:hypothetical protein